MPACQLRRSGLRSSATILRGSSGHHFRRTKAEGIAGGEILPLPSVAINHPFRWNSLPLSRVVIRKLQKRAHVDGWLDVGISAINSLGGFHSSKSKMLPAKLGNHSLHVQALRGNYMRMGAPPDAWCAQGAFCELQGSCSSYASSASSHAIYREGHVALPDVGFVGASLGALLNDQDRLLLDSPNRFICRGSGGFGKRAGYRIWPPPAKSLHRFVVNINTKSIFLQKLTAFLWFSMKNVILAERGINF
jgi:hypothetical protein